QVGTRRSSCGKQKRRQRTTGSSLRNGTHVSSLIASIVRSERRDRQRCRTKRSCARLRAHKTRGSKVPIPDIELRRPAPHGTAFTRMNGGDTCLHSRQLWSRRATAGKRSASPISTKPI